MTWIGNKAANLLRLRDEFGFNVPQFMVVTFEEAVADWPGRSAQLSEVANQALAGKLSDQNFEAKVAEILGQTGCNPNVLEELAKQGFTMGLKRVSYRTSAALEDSAEASFAGIYESFLDQPLTTADLEKNILACLASAVSLRVIGYARDQGIRQFRLGGSVVVQQMFFGRSSGVLFTEDGNGNLLLAFNQQWENSVVAGEDATELLVERATLENAKLPWQIKELCRKALVLEAAEGIPVDVEWSFDNHSVAFLQYRPVTEPMLQHAFTWDATNISENYPGITLPLTYSVIRRLYAGVYLEFFRMLGARDREIRAQSPVTDNMLGYLNGRVYYRITTWYQALKLLPGRRNLEYFESMLNPVRKRGGGKKTPMDLRSVTTGLRFVWLLLTSERRSRRFSVSIAEKIAYYDQLPLEFVNAPTIVDSGKKIRIELLSDWSVPILNDIRLMVFHGALKRIFDKSTEPGAYLRLIRGLSDRASIKPLAKLTLLGQQATRAMESANVATLEELAATPSWPNLRAQAAAYISEFAARTPGELKLENRRLTDDVMSVLELAIRATDSEIEHRPDAQRAKTQWPTGFNPALRPLALWLAKNTRQAIDWRERFRFNRAQTFNLSRKAFDAIGEILASEQVITEPRDIYWLTDQEVDDLVNGHAPTSDARAVVAARKVEFAKYEKLDQGLAMEGAGKIASLHLNPVAPSTSSVDNSGNGVAPGVVTAPAIVLHEFDPTADVRGKILVVKLIDPGWTLLFTQAAGVITERGNALSHAAIISREIGIPAIVALRGATSTISTGQVITMNGTTGAVDLGTL